VTASNARDELLKPRGGAALAQHADPREGLATSTKGHDPPEPTRRHTPPEVHLDVIDAGKRCFDLGAVHEQPRQPEAERAIESIARAARDHGRARADRPLRGPYLDTLGAAVDAPYALARVNRRARVECFASEDTIECDAVHDRCPHRVGVDDD
jgi:hypothetical protein